MAEVDTAVNAIWPVVSTRPELLFYDLACARWTYLVTHPDVLWGRNKTHRRQVFHHIVDA